MKAGTLNETIIIEEPIVSRNDYGDETIIWKELTRTRAEVKFNSGNRAIENQEIVNNYTILFNIRFYHLVNENMRIKWKNKNYRIIYIEENRGKQFKTIKGDLINE